MTKIFLTGSSGFVGTYVKSYFERKYDLINFQKNTKPKMQDCDIVLHFAGKAHDLKNIGDINSYYEVNTELTKQIFDEFLLSKAKVFVFLSSVKAVADNLTSVLLEDHLPEPLTHYGKSKLLAENYIISKVIPEGKRVYILRPCMIHGPGNKGNFNLLFKIIKKGFPWPLGSFKNERSFCSIDNLCFIINELIENNQIPSGIYNIADDEPLSTNELIQLISKSLGKKASIWNIPKSLIIGLSKIGNKLKLPLNTERLDKLTETYIVSNHKIKNVINKSLPISSRDGLLKTLNSFIGNA